MDLAIASRGTLHHMEPQHGVDGVVNNVDDVAQYVQSFFLQHEFLPFLRFTIRPLVPPEEPASEERFELLKHSQRLIENEFWMVRPKSRWRAGKMKYGYSSLLLPRWLKGCWDSEVIGAHLLLPNSNKWTEKLGRMRDEDIVRLSDTTKVS